MPVEWIVAVRFLLDGRTQTLLIIAGVAVGVGVVIFTSALITGLQASLIERTLGSQPHVTLSRPDEVARAQYHESGTTYLRRYEPAPQRLRSIDQWPQAVVNAGKIPGAVSVAPLVSGAALAVRGAASKSVLIMGVDALEYNKVIPITKYVIAGRFDVTTDYVVLGQELAADLGVAVDDTIRLTTAERPEGALFTIAGILDLGMRDLNLRWAYVSMRSAQTLLDLVGGVTDIYMRTSDIAIANRVADEAAARTGLTADSWAELNTQLESTIRAQNITNILIRLFVGIAVALGIASVLAISVIQKSNEIGILRAMGSTPRRVRLVFLLQGLIVGIIGSAFGMGIGLLMSRILESATVQADGTPLFFVTVTADLILTAIVMAIVIGLVAAYFPARRAARLDPVEAIGG
jgi:lipoprotein-releasing system permease protein